MIASSRPDVASSPITARTCTNPESNWAKNAKPEKLIPVYEQKAEAYHIVHQSSRLLHPKAHHRLTRLIVTVSSLPWKHNLIGPPCRFIFRTSLCRDIARYNTDIQCLEGERIRKVTLDGPRVNTYKHRHWLVLHYLRLKRVWSSCSLLRDKRFQTHSDVCVLRCHQRIGLLITQ